MPRLIGGSVIFTKVFVAVGMAQNRIRRKFYITIFLCSGMLKTQASPLEGQLPSSCPFTESISCGKTTLKNGDTVPRVVKSLANEEAWWMKGVPELENVEQRLTCATPDCLSNPCQNGGTCTETLVGFHCTCPPEFYGEICACPIIYKSDVSSKRNYTFLNITSGMTSFEFEVRATKGEAFIGLFRSIGEQYTAEIGVGSNDNTGARIFIPSTGTRSQINHVWTLSGISTYDHFHLSFANGIIRLIRDGSNSVLKFPDPNFPEIKVVGIWIGFGSQGYWKLPTLC